MTYKLITPPDNWRHPIEITQEQLALLEAVAGNNNAVFKVDEEHKKVYMGMKPVEKNGDHVVYPSGVELPVVSEPTDPNDDFYCDHRRKGILVAVSSTTRRMKLSPHFVLGEFVCHDPAFQKYVRVHTDLVVLLEKLRNEWCYNLGLDPASPKSGFTINSAYRPRPYNHRIGGASNSEHIAGTAADITPNLTNWDYKKFYQLCDAVVGSTGGVGYYPNDYFVHVDVRGYSSRW